MRSRIQILFYTVLGACVLLALFVLLASNNNNKGMMDNTTTSSFILLLALEAQRAVNSIVRPGFLERLFQSPDNKASHLPSSTHVQQETHHPVHHHQEEEEEEEVYDTSRRRRLLHGPPQGHDMALYVGSTSRSIISPRSPVLVMGLPRSGSIALHHFFVCNGYSSAHYCCGQNHPNATQTQTHFPCTGTTATAEGSLTTTTTTTTTMLPTCGAQVHRNFLQNKPAFSEQTFQVYSQFDVETSEPYGWFLPQHFALPLLHQSYPNAVWILNERKSPAVWANSVAHWYSVTLRLLTSFGWDYHDPFHRSPPPPPERKNTTTTTTTLIAPFRSFREPETRQGLHRGVIRAGNVTLHQQRQVLLQEIYANHTRKVLAFCAKYRPHLLLVRINVDDDPEATRRVLANAFGHANPACWQFDPNAYDSDWKNISLPF